MRIQVWAASDIGKIKKNNEDLALIDHVFIRDEVYESQFDIIKPMAVAVADGVGGAEGGEIASEMVLKSLLDFITKIDDTTSENISHQLKEWACATNKSILEFACNEGYRGMGTTLSGILFLYEETFIFNAGDSRIYRYRDGILRQLTTDHTLRELSRNKDIPGNIIYNAFGVEKDFFIDIINITSQIRTNDSFLICSDGLSDLVSNDEIEKCLESDSPAIHLVSLANQHGGKDNITAIFINTML